MLKFAAVAEKTAKNFRGLHFLPHPVDHQYPLITKACLQSILSIMHIWKNCHFL